LPQCKWTKLDLIRPKTSYTLKVGKIKKFIKNNFIKCLFITCETKQLQAQFIVAQKYGFFPFNSRIPTTGTEHRDRSKPFERPLWGSAAFFIKKLKGNRAGYEFSTNSNNNSFLLLGYDDVVG
jgi:hypothetical protein